MEHSESLVEENRTLRILSRVLKLSKLSITHIFRTILGQQPPGEDDQLSLAHTVFLLLADRFERLPFLEPEQRAVLLAEIWSTLFRQTFALDMIVHVVFIDNSHCTWTGQTSFLDMKTGERVENLPHPAMETIGYNLNELYRRGMLRATKSTKQRSPNVPEHSHSSMEEQGYVCLGPTDALFGQVRDRGAELGPDNNDAGD